MPAPFATHEVFNQPPPLEDVNLFSSDTALMETVEREGGGDASERLQAFGRLAGSAEALGRGRLANEHPPRLSTHDARGNRSDTVTYHPAYHELMRASCGEGLHSSVWADLADAGKAPRLGTHVRRAGAFYMAAQMEAGHCCPITMTNAAVPVLLLEPTLAKEWVPRILPFKYDPSFAPAAKKSAVTLGMGMTEKQGGTDVRAATTKAEPVGKRGSGAEYVVTGHKWFMSAPMSDAFLVLPGGLGTFDEFFEVAVEAQLGVHAKPIIVVNVNGYFDALDALLHATVKAGFAKDTILKLCYQADGAEAALEILEGALNAPARS